MTAFTIDAKPLRAALDACSLVVTQSSDLPILSHVRITATENGVDLLATDSVCWLALGPLPANVADPGAAAVPLAKLRGYVSGLPDGAQVEISIGEKLHMGLRGPTGRGRVACLPADHFPAAPKDLLDIPGAPLQVDGKLLAEHLDYCTHTMETGKGARDYLEGVWFQAIDGAWPAADTRCLRLVSSDGMNLSLHDTPLPDPAAWTADALVPARAVKVLHKLAGEAAEPIELSAHLAGLRMLDRQRGLTLVTRLVAAKIPPYERLLNVGETLATIEMDPSVMAAALGRLRALVTDPQGVVLRADAADASELVHLEAYDNLGQASETVDGCAVTGAATIGLNPRHMQLCLGDTHGRARLTVYTWPDHTEPRPLWTDTARPHRLRLQNPVKMHAREVDAAAGD